MESVHFLKNRWSVPLFILICSFILYGNGIKNKYALDDSLVVTNNKNVLRGISGIPDIITSKTFKDEKSSYAYRPLPLITFAIEYQLFGANPHISHLISIFLYSIVCLLLFLTMYLLFPSSFSLIFLATLLFLFHPLHTEVVNNIKCRDELLMMIFSLSSFFFFSKFYFSNKWNYFLLAIFLMFAALFCKQSAITFSLIIPFSLYFTSGKPQFKKNLLIFFSILSLFVLFIFLRKTTTINDDQVRILNYFENPLYETGFAKRIPVIFFTLIYYLKLLFLPVNLSFYYGFNQVPIPDWKSYLPFLGIVITIILLLLVPYFYKKQKLISLGILLFGIGIGPFLNIIPVPGIFAERFVFIGSIGWALSVAGALTYYLKTDSNNSPWLFSNKIFFLIVTLILILFTGRIILRNPDWKDQLTLYKHDIHYLDNSAKAHSMLAGELIATAESAIDINIKNNLLAEAVRHYEKSVTIFPRYASAWNNMGTIYFSHFAQYDYAIFSFQKALESDSTFSKASFNLAYSYEKTKTYEKAILFYKNTINLDPKFIQAYRNLGKIYFSNGRIEEALAVSGNAILQNSKNPSLYVDAANYSVSTGDTLAAISHFETAFKLEQDNSQKSLLGNHLYQLFQKTGNKEKLNHYSKFRYRSY